LCASRGTDDRRPPDCPATALLARWVPSPCDRLSRPRTTTDPPPRPGAISRQRACPPPPTMGVGEGGTGTVPTFTTSRSTGLAPSSSPCSIATSTPQTFLVASPPTALDRLRSPRPPTSRTACAALRPRSTSLEPASLLRGFNHWFTSVTPFRLAQRAPRRLMVPTRLAFIGAAPALTRASRLRLPPASTGLLRQPDGGVLSSPLDSWRLVAHNAVVTRTSSSSQAA
jgi:hypothetical protein